MLKKSRIVLLLCFTFIALTLNACKEDGHHDHDKGGHDHHQEAESSHNEAELEAESHTIWTDSAELFVEFDPLIVGESSRFLAHLTNQKTFKPLTEGSLTVALKDKNGKSVLSTMMSEPTRRGIFIPSLSPQKPGIYTIVFELKSKDLSETITISDIHVYRTKDEAMQSQSNTNAGGATLSFLKEQAWDIAFKTMKAQEKSVGVTFKTTGELVQNADGWILKVDYPKHYVSIESDIQSIEFKPDYLNELFTVPHPKSDQRRLVVRSERSAFLPKFYPLASNKQFVPGSLTEIWITTSSQPKNQIVIPYSALLEQEGQHYLYIQTEGESFEKRPVEVKAIVGNEALIQSGLKKGERIVVTGATAIKLSSLSGSLPVHSH